MIPAGDISSRIEGTVFHHRIVQDLGSESMLFYPHALKQRILNCEDASNPSPLTSSLPPPPVAEPPSSSSNPSVIEASAPQTTASPAYSFALSTTTTMMKHFAALPFLQPFSELDYPPPIVLPSTPIGLTLIHQRLLTKTYYQTLDMWQADIDLLRSNATHLADQVSDFRSTDELVVMLRVLDELYRELVRTGLPVCDGSMADVAVVAVSDTYETNVASASSNKAWEQRLETVSLLKSLRLSKNGADDDDDSEDEDEEDNDENDSDRKDSKKRSGKKVGLLSDLRRNNKRVQMSGCLHLLRNSENGFTPPGFTTVATIRQRQRHMYQRFFPSSSSATLLHHRSDRCYIGQFSRDGNTFFAGYQSDSVLCLFKTDNEPVGSKSAEPWKIKRSIPLRHISWTVSDIDLSPTSSHLLYSSMSPVIHVVSLNSSISGDHDEDRRGISSDLPQVQCVLADPHDPQSMYARCAVFSARFSDDCRSIVAGTSSNKVFLYDIASERCVLAASGHRDDVNSVSWANSTSNIFFSGSDDCTIKVWDKRTMGSGGSRGDSSCGTFLGHTEGLTHVTSKGDGFYLLSNSKDQRAKLFDIRMMSPSTDVAVQASAERIHRSSGTWDYRFQNGPSRLSARLREDSSVMTYEGAHQVKRTLIRSYFSPMASTAQRYVYTGSADGKVVIYDALTGQSVSSLRLHGDVVRDCSWHPHYPLLVSVSWDGSVVASSVETNPNLSFAGDSNDDDDDNNNNNNNSNDDDEEEEEEHIPDDGDDQWQDDN